MQLALPWRFARPAPAPSPPRARLRPARLPRRKESRSAATACPTSSGKCPTTPRARCAGASPSCAACSAMRSSPTAKPPRSTPRTDRHRLRRAQGRRRQISPRLDRNPRTDLRRHQRRLPGGPRPPQLRRIQRLAHRRRRGCPGLARPGLRRTGRPRPPPDRLLPHVRAWVERSPHDPEPAEALCPCSSPPAARRKRSAAPPHPPPRRGRRSRHRRRCAIAPQPLPTDGPKKPTTPQAGNPLLHRQRRHHPRLFGHRLRSADRQGRQLAQPSRGRSRQPAVAPLDPRPDHDPLAVALRRARQRPSRLERAAQFRSVRRRPRKRGRRRRPRPLRPARVSARAPRSPSPMRSAIPNGCGRCTCGAAMRSAGPTAATRPRSSGARRCSS